MRRLAWWHVTAIILTLLAAAMPPSARELAGPRGAQVHVRWRAAIDLATRQQLEVHYRLLDGAPLDGNTWRYDLIDPSSENIRALVSDPAIEDTHDIDRPTSSLVPSATRTARRLRMGDAGDVAVWVSDWLAILFASVSVALVVAGVCGRAQQPGALLVLLRQPRWVGDLNALATRATNTRAARWLSRGIPEIDARTLGVFRVMFGLAVTAVVASRGIDTARLEATFDPQIDGALHAAVMDWLGAHPALTNLLTPWLLITGTAFTLGIFTRLTYALFVAAALVWAYAAVAIDSTHPHSTLMLTLVALLPCRWGDAVSADAWLRSLRGHPSAARPPGKAYGYGVWIPGLVFGVALAAAAWAKMAPNGLRWILNGSVKYHFVSDAANAAVTWGLTLAAHPLLAVVVSFGAVVVEAVVVTAAFVRSERYRFIAGLAALGLLVGFRLFMGLFWPGWWILLIGFLPWHTLSRLSGFRASPHPTSGPATATLMGVPTAAQLALVTLVIGQQILFSTLAIERAPVFSHYPMYSATYASPAEFGASFRPFYRIVVLTDEGREDLSCNASLDLVADLREALRGSETAAASVWRAVRGCRPDLANAKQVSIEEDRRAFDWDQLEFTVTRAVSVVGPLLQSR